MKKLLMLIISALLVLGMTACSGGSNDVASDTDNGVEEAAAEQIDETGSNDGNFGTETLVVYFSATGNTRGVAEKIASITGADIYEIKAAQEYTDEDLDWNDSDSRTTYEQNDPDARPEIGSEDISLKDYNTIYLGYPIWHGQAPRIMNTFVEKYSFEGITVIPFCTSGSSGIGQSAVTLEGQAGNGRWLSGERFGGDVSDDELKAWIDEVRAE